ncbi:hypothetical protein UA08_09497 [Talaromyces atroroseus]|uniref:Uncharacterized protein n=1 Tax=Talaromyces atroroseus TaxID=1441469 RepID=A0A1Q5Q6F5_TALAT|nr:hypothetical protein UA08_09497 [Talaromyces atroroseus]OKL55230.1 hypothetical protein UA08_09497 [Talaromyces atroroseus]
METYPDDGIKWEEMEEHGYAILHGAAEPPQELRDSILTKIQKHPEDFTLVQYEDSPLYYIQPRWGTVLFREIEEYVQHGINYSAHYNVNLDGLDPSGLRDQVRVVGCWKTESTGDTSTNYMLGPQDYRTGDAMVLIRPIAEEVNFRPFDGSHLLTKSEFDQSNRKTTLLSVRRKEALKGRTTLWTQWPDFSESSEVLFATIVYVNNPARPPGEDEDFPGCVKPGCVAPFMRY